MSSIRSIFLLTLYVFLTLHNGAIVAGPIRISNDIAQKKYDYNKFYKSKILTLQVYALVVALNKKLQERVSCRSIEHRDTRVKEIKSNEKRDMNSVKAQRLLRSNL